MSTVILGVEKITQIKSEGDVHLCSSLFDNLFYEMLFEPPSAFHDTLYRLCITDFVPLIL